MPPPVATMAAHGAGSASGMCGGPLPVAALYRGARSDGGVHREDLAVVGPTRSRWLVNGLFLFDFHRQTYDRP